MPVDSPTFTPDLPSHAAFKRAEGGCFTLAGGSDALRLARVTDRHIQGGWESFSLLLEWPAEGATGQGLYTLRHASLGELALFLVPVGVSGDQSDCHLYEAAFSRPASA
jgi:hypothetical protein